MAKLSKALGTVLIVDDDEMVLRTLERVMRGSGYECKTTTDGRQAAELTKTNSFDVVLSDIDMPGFSGIDVLKAVRANDQDVPVILITGDPGLETAIRAVKYGAFRYLTKPVDVEVLSETVAYAAQMHRLALLKREALTLLGHNDKQASDLAGLERDFDCALGSLWMAFQPIVSWSQKKVVGHEALMRSVEPALPHPGAILAAAEKLDRLPDLGVKIRNSIASELTDLPPDIQIFVNLHARDLNDESLYSRVVPLSRHANRITLEITERVDLSEIKDVEKRVAALREMGFRLAVDDLGAGYAGLTSFVKLKPEIVKVDMSLVRDIHLDTAKQKLVRSLLILCEGMEIQTVIEGIETPQELETLVGMGADLMQGYHFASPGLAFPKVDPSLFQLLSVNSDAVAIG